MKYRKTSEMLAKVGPGDVWYCASGTLRRIAAVPPPSVYLQAFADGIWRNREYLGCKPWYRAAIETEPRSSEAAAVWGSTGPGQGRRLRLTDPDAGDRLWWFEKGRWWWKHEGEAKRSLGPPEDQLFVPADGKDWDEE